MRWLPSSKKMQTANYTIKFSSGFLMTIDDNSGH